MSKITFLALAPTLFLSLFLVDAFGKNNLSNIVDFKEQGVLYNIEEENGDDLIKKRIAELNTTKIENLMAESYENSFKSNLNIHDSNIDSIETKKDMVPAKFDIKDSIGNILYAQGELIPSIIPAGTSLDLCFIDGSDEEEVIRFELQSFGKCIYFVNKIDSREFEKKYNQSAYPLSNQNEEYIVRFGVKALPTKVTKVGAELTTKTLNIVEIKKRLEK